MHVYVYCAQYQASELISFGTLRREYMRSRTKTVSRHDTAVLICADADIAQLTYGPFDHTQAPLCQSGGEQV